MEEKQARFNMAGVLRLLLGVLIVVIVAFLLVRFISGRRTNEGEVNTGQNTASQQAEGEARQDQNESTAGDGSEDSTENDGEGNSAEADEPTPIPSGFEDSSTGSSSRADSQLPEAGMGENVIIATIVLTLGAYTVVRVAQKARI